VIKRSSVTTRSASPVLHNAPRDGRLDALSEPEIKIGTCGYSYPGPPPKGWAGVFYPTKGKRLDALEYYSRFFDTVEINSSFYGPPSPAMAEGWARKTPDDFQFSVKLWQKFTHARKVNQPGAAPNDAWDAITQADVDVFRSGVEPLARSGKFGTLLLQYPAGFYATPENIEKLAATLRTFREYPQVVELRHRSWSDAAGETLSLLESHRAGLALIDEPKFESSIRQEPKVVGETLYFRAHGRNAAKWWTHGESWERYDYLYSSDEIKALAGRLRAATTASPHVKTVKIYFNNHARASAAVNALMLLHELGLTVKSAPGADLLASFPQLAAIFPERNLDRKLY
jgi:uncharacterized protein YecE (DUF72 family)